MERPVRFATSRAASSNESSMVNVVRISVDDSSALMLRFAVFSTGSKSPPLPPDRPKTSTGLGHSGKSLPSISTRHCVIRRIGKLNPCRSLHPPQNQNKVISQQLTPRGDPPKAGSTLTKRLWACSIWVKTLMLSKMKSQSGLTDDCSLFCRRRGTGRSTYCSSARDPRLRTR